MQKKEFIRQLNELVPRPDPVTTEALYRFDRECAESEYSNAQTGTNEYISVVIEDKGEITHYGHILQLDGTTNGASGTASLTLPAGVTLDNDTKLYVFNEQYNGDTGI